MTDFRAMFGDELWKRRTVEWAEVEAALGVGLPEDYKSYAEQYPALYFDSLITILHPGHADPALNLLAFGKRIRDAWRAFGPTFGPPAMSLSMYPAAGGLLLWGFDADLGYYFWRTRGKPSEWTIVVEESSQWWEFDGGFGDFWASLTNGEISSPVIPEGFPDEDYVVEEA
ncbi:SMI1/KNR4 family protein [Amycolatopsis solani]|uniref:SMI1/KNR4 family protein n=1 Tax=Amycolatopsis solani TaxID=3028615 RepID=UPI0025B03278|nr:SMI1/KNR4 family protein [Amycolatopsis sp. MEP2-6]